ncbi:GDSL-type esterase/lipase family protein [Robiginitomaculum antarcticum]|uniref:GDSL-type esterase/lipase family protein n=1 Tax=Robiginitomaculum antarcticum TaxID=437507 RepID=UPI0003784D83|nr:GDSL-type esterase/lipase family protein [Robiginitomaculum antarcticum]
MTRQILISFSLAAALAACAPDAAQTQTQTQNNITPAQMEAELTIPPPDWMYEDGQSHFNLRVAQIEAAGANAGGILLIGDSITEGWMEQDFPYVGPVANHGVGWDVTEGVLTRAPQILREDPKAVFVMIGTNDLSYDRTPDQILPPLRASLLEYVQRWPEAKIYLQSVLPRNGQWDKSVVNLNDALVDLSREDGLSERVTFIDLSPVMGTSADDLREDYTHDGIHLTEAGYDAWAEALQPYLPRD